MKAQVLHAVNDIRYEEVKEPVLKKEQVLVKVHACGVCGSDIPRIYKNGTYHFPTIPGHEFSGEVVDTYDQMDEHLLHKRVGVFPLIPCMECKQCKKGLYEMCEHYNYLGSRCDGGFAQYVAVPKWNLTILPDNVTYEQAAMLEPMAVAVHAIRRLSDIDHDNNIAIIGLGTIGLFVLMFLKNMGFENVCVIGNKTFQKDMALKLGISEKDYFDYNNVSNSINSALDAADVKSDLDEYKNLMNRFDVVFEVVGKNDSINLSLKLAAPLGKACLVGNPASDISFDKENYWMILRKQLAVTGTWNSSFNHDKDDDWNFVIDRLEKGLIHPEIFITHKYPLAGIKEGFELMHSKKENYIKIMCET